MPDIRPSVESFRFWRRMTNLWTLVFFAAALYDFYDTNVLENNDVLLALSAVYAASLAIYSAEKEFRRWHDVHDSLHPGEWYTLIWTGLVVFLALGGLIFKKSYHLPPEVSAAYIAVISILAITRESKNFYRRSKKDPASQE